MAASVVIFGGTGMLGTAVVDELSASGIPFTATTRSLSAVEQDLRPRFVEFDAATQPVSVVLDRLERDDVVVNCIGVIKHHMDDSNSAHRRNAIAINSEFPYGVVEAAAARGARVIQIATDCVYSGSSGSYDEHALHDATDVYGQSKSLGEVPAPELLNLRCSIIGRERSTETSLLEWVLSHEAGSTFSGYTDHWWNGVTTRAFARIVIGAIRSGDGLAGTFHVVPADKVNKSDLSSRILQAFGVDDVEVVPVVTGHGVDRTLSTLHPDVNARLWHDAGYAQIPTVGQMVDDLVLQDSHLRSEMRA